MEVLKSFSLPNPVVLFLLGVIKNTRIVWISLYFFSFSSQIFASTQTKSKTYADSSIYESPNTIGTAADSLPQTDKTSETVLDNPPETLGKIPFVHDNRPLDSLIAPDGSDSAKSETNINPEILKPAILPKQAKTIGKAFVPLELKTHRVVSKKVPVESFELEREHIKIMSSTMGDPIRSLGRTPGIQNQNDLNAKPYIRGGKWEEVRVFLNGIPMLQPYHTGGVFSNFNLESVEKLELRSSLIRAEEEQGLSGQILIDLRQPSTDSLHLFGEASMLRSNWYAETPILKNKLSVQGGGQYFLFGKTLHSLLTGISYTSSDSNFNSDIESYKQRLNLPEFQDHQWGLFYTPAENHYVNYSGFISQDDYQIVIPAAQNILPKPDPTLNPGSNVIPDVNLFPRQEINRSKKLAVDSLSQLQVKGQAHILNYQWYINDHMLWTGSAGYQQLGQNVLFKEGLEVEGPLAMDLQQQQVNLKSLLNIKTKKNQQYNLGFSLQENRNKYLAQMPYPLYDVILNSNMDMLDALGFYTSKNFEIQRIDLTKGTFDHLGELPLRIQFNHLGEYKSQTLAGFASWEGSLNQNSHLYLGSRMERESLSEEIFWNPSAQYAHNLNPSQQIQFSLGLHNQSFLPFYQRASNFKLKSEKSANFNSSYSWDISPKYQIKLGAYYKKYWDLVNPILIPQGEIDAQSLLIPRPYSGISPETQMYLRDYIKNSGGLAGLNEEQTSQALFLFGDQNISYLNEGSGQAFGGELGLYYQYSPTWFGWVTLEANKSYRKDSPREVTYEYRYFRPWAMNWINYFKMPSQYEISFSFQMAAGHPYTPYSGTLQDDPNLYGEQDLIYIGQRNSGELAVYSRADIRLGKNSRLFGYSLKTYMEIWNAFNRPNYFSRDAKTGQLKAAELNWPFPFLFFGCEIQI